MTTAQKIKELKAQIAALTVTAQKSLEDKDVDKAATALDEAETLEKECALLTRMLDREKEGVQDAPAPVKSSEKVFAQAFRDGFPAQKDMSEGSDADGGYTVPEDIRTRVEQYRDAKFSLRQLVDVENVRTKSGRRTFQKRAQQSAFSKIGEGGKIGRRSTPQFEILEYSVDKYGGYMPVTNELLEDSDANITQIMVNWLGDAARVTDNALILAQLGTKAVTVMETIEELKYAVIVTLGQAFAETCAIITNDDGLLWMDTLKDENGRALLKDSATDVLPPRIAIGTRNIPVRILPNTDLPTEFEYGASDDTTVKSCKTYYTRTGAGTAQSPYSYTPVENPTGNPKTSGYYEVTASLIPMIPGDLHEGIKLFDRRKLQLKMSDVAVVGAGDDQLNAYEDDLTLIRALERLDVRVKDAAAFVNGRLRIAYA